MEHGRPSGLYLLHAGGPSACLHGWGWLMGDVVLMMDPHRTMVSDRGATIQIWYVPNLERSFLAPNGDRTRDI